MKKLDFKLILPHIIAFVTFLLLSIAFTKPALEGKVLLQQDVQQVNAMQKQSMEFHEKNGYYPRWTNSMFGGMPAYLIAFGPKSGSLISVESFTKFVTLGFPKPVYFLFLAGIFFYLLCIVIGINPWLSILGGIAYGYCSYNPLLIVSGHDTKMISLAYIPAIIASVLLIFKQKYWIGSPLLLIFMTLIMAQNHLQMVYYLLIMLLFLGLHLLVKFIKEKDYKHLLIGATSSILLIIVAVMIAAMGFLSAFEYTKESNRGGSELTAADSKNQTKGGLDKDYAFNWSYGKMETFSFIIPNACGGGSSTPLQEDSKVSELLQQTPGISQDGAQQLFQAASAYWGGKPNTAGPVYFGAFICVLFLMGMILSKSEHKWWLLGITVLGILLAWGKHFETFNYFLFDHLPFYNKFRTPEMSLVMTQLAVPLMAVIFLNDLTSITDKEKLASIGKKCLIITGSVAAAIAGFYFFASFKNEATDELKKSVTNAFQNNPDFAKSYISALIKDRQTVFLSDMWRSLGFILIGIAAVYLYTKNIFKAPVLYIALILCTTIDLVGVGKRYLTFDNFIEPVEYENSYADYNADIQIKRDPGFYRVLNLAFKNQADGPFQVSVNQSFNDAIASYKHNTIGGYFPAKLGIYADLVQNQLYKNIERWGANPAAKDSFRVLNMLNMKYVIVPDQNNPKQTAAIPNPYAMGNCWLVKDIQYVKNADEEMAALDKIDPATTAVINEKFKSEVGAFTPSNDSAAFIKLIENKNDEAKYEFNSSTSQFAVFSEIYYSKGWDAYVDGKKVPYCKVNYVLRGMSVPAGKHTIEFKFDSSLIRTSETLAKASGIFSIIFVLFCIFMIWKTNRKK